MRTGNVTKRQPSPEAKRAKLRAELKAPKAETPGQPKSAGFDRNALAALAKRSAGASAFQTSTAVSPSGASFAEVTRRNS